MTRLENLQAQLRMSAQKCGENEPLTLELKQRVEEMQQRILSGDGLLDTGEGGLQHFHAGFRKMRRARPTGDKGMKTRRNIPKILSPDEQKKKKKKKGGGFKRRWPSNRKLSRGI